MNELIIALAGLLTAFLVNLINKKTKEISESTKNATAEKYVNLLSNTITEAVISTNQVYVDSLKSRGEFSVEAQHEAFEMTLNKVNSLLTTEAKKYLAEIYGDLSLYIVTKIEAEVKGHK